MAPEASIPPIHINKRHRHRPGIVRGPTARLEHAVADFGCSGLPACLNGLKDEYNGLKDEYFAYLDDLGRCTRPGDR